jgi:hypothetical protein
LQKELPCQPEARLTPRMPPTSGSRIQVSAANTSFTDCRSGSARRFSGPCRHNQIGHDPNLS